MKVRAEVGIRFENKMSGRGGVYAGEEGVDVDVDEAEAEITLVSTPVRLQIGFLGRGGNERAEITVGEE